MTQTIAQEVRGKGITANAALPSIIDTAANRAAMPGADCAGWVTTDSIAHQIVWLCSEEAADVSGAMIPVYGRS